MHFGEERPTAAPWAFRAEIVRVGFERRTPDLAANSPVRAIQSEAAVGVAHPSPCRGINQPDVTFEQNPESVLQPQPQVFTRQIAILAHVVHL
ncbi:MAG: hypothetical protein ABSC42_15405 [Tepidisphaeraceae bacterium]